jgi:hypothetical protein
MRGQLIFYIFNILCSNIFEVKLYKIESVSQKNIHISPITASRYTHILGNSRVLSIYPKIYKQSIFVLTLHLECFCVHQQRIVLQKDLFQPQKFVFGTMKRFLLLLPGVKFLNTALTYLLLLSNFLCSNLPADLFVEISFNLLHKFLSKCFLHSIFSTVRFFDPHYCHRLLLVYDTVTRTFLLFF